jgi:hypothetical protein
MVYAGIKNGEKIAILTHITAIEAAKKDLNIGFQEKTLFSPKISENCNYNIDPRYLGCQNKSSYEVTHRNWSSLCT